MITQQIYNVEYLKRMNVVYEEKLTRLKKLNEECDKIIELADKLKQNFEKQEQILDNVSKIIEKIKI